MFWGGERQQNALIDWGSDQNLRIRRTNQVRRTWYQVLVP